jgi:hypothetical protein
LASLNIDPDDVPSFHPQYLSLFIQPSLRTAVCSSQNRQIHKHSKVIWKSHSRTEVSAFKITFIDRCGSGKTSIINRFHEGSFPDQSD